MITLNKNSRQTKLFLWCLKNPMTRHSYEKEDGTLWSRDPEWYLENGTTLCHFFFACLWVPLLIVGAFSFMAIALINMHMSLYEKYGTPGLFIPSSVAMIAVSLIATIILIVIGSGKIGLSSYLYSLKNKICLRMEFTGNQLTTKGE